MQAYKDADIYTSQTIRFSKASQAGIILSCAVAVCYSIAISYEG